MSKNEDASTPEQIAAEYGIKLIKVIANFDIHSRNKKVLGSDPADLSKIPRNPVKSLIRPWAVICIYAHQGQEQDIADLLAAKPIIVDLIVQHADKYRHANGFEFTIREHNGQQQGNMIRALQERGRQLRDIRMSDADAPTCG